MEFDERSDIPEEIESVSPSARNQTGLKESNAYFSSDPDRSEILSTSYNLRQQEIFNSQANQQDIFSESHFNDRDDDDERDENDD